MLNPAAAVLLALMMLTQAGCSYMNVKTSSSVIAEAGGTRRRMHQSQVKVFDAAPPSEPYVELARIKAVGRRDVDRGQLMEALRIRAARLGADAIMGVEFSSEPVKGGAGGGMVCPFEGPCYYQETDSTIIGMPTASCTAIRIEE